MLADHAATLKETGHSLRLESAKPHLISVQTGYGIAITVYTLDQEVTRIGSRTGGEDATSTRKMSDPVNDIVLPDLEAEHCALRLVSSGGGRESTTDAVMLHAISNPCFVNEVLVNSGDQIELHHGDVVQLGGGYLFRFNHPAAAERIQQGQSCTYRGFFCKV